MEKEKLFEVFEEFVYVYEHYGGDMPFTVLLDNYHEKRGVIISNLRLDKKTQTVELETDQGTISINKDHPWRLKHGRTKSGKTIFTRHLE